MKIKILFKIISILLIIIIIFPYSVVLAEGQRATSADVGNAIATFAIEYYKAAQNGTVPYLYHPKNVGSGYVSGWKVKRAIPDDGIGDPILNPYRTYGVSYNHYGLDCVAWVNYCIYKVTKWSFTNVHNGEGGYVTPGGIKDSNHFEQIEGNGNSAIAGDILYDKVGEEFMHVIVCTGPKQGLESNSGGTRKGPYEVNGRDLSRYKIARVKETAADDFFVDDLKIDPNLVMGGGFSQGIESEFYYNGVPNGEYSVAGDFWEWIVGSLKEVFSFLINIIFYIFRMVFVGFTAIVDNLITYVVKSIAGVEANFFDDATSGWRKDEGDVEKVNIETIIFDDMFDINFFRDPTPADTTT